MDQGNSSDSDEVFQDASDQSSSLPPASPSSFSDTAILEKIPRRKPPRVSVSSFAAAIKRGQASVSSSMADSTVPHSPSTPDSFKFVEPVKRKPRVSVSSFAMALRKNQTISDQTTSNSSEPTTPVDARPLAVTKRKPRVSVGDFLKAFSENENKTGSNSSTLPSEPPTPKDAKPLTVNAKKPRVSVGSFVQALREDSSTDEEPELMRERFTSNDTVPSPNLSSPALAQSRPASRKDDIAEKPAEIPTTPHNMKTNQTVQNTSESIASVNLVTSVESLTTDEVSERSPAAQQASASKTADVSQEEHAEEESGKEEVQEEEDKEEVTDQEEDEDEPASAEVTPNKNEAPRESEDEEEERDQEEEKEESASVEVQANKSEAPRQSEDEEKETAKEEDDEEAVSAEVQGNKSEAPEESEDEDGASEQKDEISEVQVEKVHQVSMQKEVLVSPAVRRLAKASTPARNSTIARIAASKSLNLSPIPAASVSSAKLFAQETRRDEEDSEEEEDEEESYESAKEEDEEENKGPAAKPEPVPAAQNVASKSFLLNPFKGKTIKIPEVLRQAYAISTSRPPPAIVPLSERAKTFPPEKRKALEALEADLKKQRLAREEPKHGTFKKPVKKPTTVATRQPKAKIPSNVTLLNGNRKNFLFYSRLRLKKDAAVAVHEMVDKFTGGILEVTAEYCEEKGISDFNNPEHFYEIMKRMGLVKNHHDYTSMVIETMWNDYHKYLLPVGMPPNWEALQKMAMLNKKK